MNLASSGAASIFEPAPAKINLALHVTGRRADSYHSLDTFVVFARLGDRLEVTLGGEDRFDVTGPFAAQVPRDGANLAVRAREAFFGRFGGKMPVAITLEKNLPAASGLGGGSSDAAAVLRALARLAPSPPEASDLAALGLTLGADVPMCLAAHPLQAGGAGEEIVPCRAFPALALVLVNPGVAVATPEVFRTLTRRDNAPLPRCGSPTNLDAIRAWLAATRNDLQDAATAIAPAISGALSALEEAGALFARMSGSGATCFGLFAAPADAEKAAARIGQSYPSWWTAATVSSPSDAGAHP